MSISMLLLHCICGKHGKVRVIASFLHVTGAHKPEPHWLWSLTKLWLLLKEQFHPPRTSHSFQACMIIQPNKTVNHMAERPVAMGKSSQWYFKNKTQTPLSSSCEVSATKLQLLNYMSNLLPYSCFHDTMLAALIIGSFKYLYLLNCHKINVPWICKTNAFIKKNILFFLS